MKKILCIFTLLLCITLTACGKQDAAGDNTPTASSSEIQSETHKTDTTVVTDSPADPVKNEDEYIYPVTGTTHEAGIYYMHPMGYGLTLEVEADGNPHELGSALRIRVADSVCDYRLVEEITTSSGYLLNAETNPGMVDYEADPYGIFGYIGDHFDFTVDSENDISDEFSVTFGIRRPAQISNDIVGFIDMHGGSLVYYTVYWDYAGSVSLRTAEADWTIKKTDTRYGEPYLKPTPVPLEEQLVSVEEPEEEEEEITWYIENRTLYVNKIYYDTVRDLTGHGMIEIEDPWAAHKDEFDAAVFNAVFERRSKRFTMNTVVDSPDYNYFPLESLGLFGASLEYLDATLYLGDIRVVNYLLGNVNVKNVNLTLKEGVRSTISLFGHNKELETASISIDGPVESVADMFYGCESLRSVNVDIDLSWTTNMTRMFSGCRSLGSVSLSCINDGCGGIFTDCDSLSFVDCSNVFISQPANWMFNEYNSISSYLFADPWNIGYNVIADHVYKAYPIFEPVTSTQMVYVYFDKVTPGWFTKFMEQTQGVTDFDCIVNSDYLKVYAKAPDKAKEDDDILKAMLSTIESAVKSIAESQGVEAAKSAEATLKVAGFMDSVSSYVE